MNNREFDNVEMEYFTLTSHSGGLNSRIENEKCHRRQFITEALPKNTSFSINLIHITASEKIFHQLRSPACCIRPLRCTSVTKSVISTRVRKEVPEVALYILHNSLYLFHIASHIAKIKESARARERETHRQTSERGGNKGGCTHNEVQTGFVAGGCTLRRTMRLVWAGVSNVCSHCLPSPWRVAMGHCTRRTSCAHTRPTHTYPCRSSRCAMHACSHPRGSFVWRDATWRDTARTTMARFVSENGRATSRNRVTRQNRPVGLS